MKKKKKKEKYSLLKKELAWINRRGKPFKQEEMLNEEGFATGSTSRKNVSNQILSIFETLIQNKFHFVLQASEGDGIKVTGNDNMTRCVMIVRNNAIQAFCLKANKTEASYLLDEAQIDIKNVNIRNTTKNDFVYVDFDKFVEPEKIFTFIKNLPPSTPCNCGRHNIVKQKIAA